MEYLVIGAGGVGGCIGAFMTEAGKDVTVIARGKHLEAILKNGLHMETPRRGNYTVIPLQARDMEHYHGRPDVIFNCVKSYSLDETIPFIRRVAHSDTLVIPLQNVYGTGARMQVEMPELLVADGCIYIAAEISEPGRIVQNHDIFRIVYGVRNPREYRPALVQVAADLQDSGITAIVSDDIKRDAMEKYAYISTMNACGLFYDATTGDIQSEGEIRDTYIALSGEIAALAEAMGINWDMDIVAANLRLVDQLSPAVITSMQRDVKAGKSSEIDGLIFEVVRMGQKYKVPVPTFQMIAEGSGFRG